MWIRGIAIAFAIFVVSGCTERTPGSSNNPETVKSLSSSTGSPIFARDDEDGNTTPPAGFTPPPGFTPPEGFTPPADFTPPPGFTPPTDLTPPPGFTPPPGLTPPGGITPPANGGTTPPANGGTTPPANGCTIPPANGGTTPPANGGTNPPANGGTTPPSGSITISFVELNDLHAHMTSHADYNSSGVLVQRGGLARIATAINNVRMENPNTIVMNIGDTYHGGVEAFYTEGNAVVDPVNGLNIDIGVPGNWDFAYGPSVSRLRYTNDSVLFNPGGQTIKQPNFPNIAANVMNVGLAPRAGQSFLPPTFMQNIAGISVGFIGITSDIVPLMHPTLARGFSFLSGLTAHSDVIMQHANDLRGQGAQIVVVMSELGIQKDLAVANGMASGLVDVFFSAHTHELVTMPITTNSGALVVESGNDTTIGRMDITVTNGSVSNMQWTIIPVDSTLAEDTNVKSLVDTARAPFLDPGVNMTPIGGVSFIVSQMLTQPIDTIIGMTPITLDRRHALENSLNNAFTETMRQTTGTQAALTLGFRFDTVNPSQGMFFEDNSIANGEVTIEDAYRFFPAPFVIATADITGAQLTQVIENALSRVFSTNAFNQWGGWFDGFAGLDINLNLAATDGNRVNSISMIGGGSVIAPGDTITITGCQRPFELSGTTLCSHDGFSNIAPVTNPTTNSNWTAVDLFIDAIQNNQLPVVNTTNITDTSNTLFWPDVDYIQPLYGVP